MTSEQKKTMRQLFLVNLGMWAISIGSYFVIGHGTGLAGGMISAFVTFLFILTYASFSLF